MFSDNFSPLSAHLIYLLREFEYCCDYLHHLVELWIFPTSLCKWELRLQLVNKGRLYYYIYMAVQGPTKYGELLMRIRIESGDSLRGMSSKLGLSPAYLSEIERGLRNIPATLDSLLLANYPNAIRYKSSLVKARLASSDVVAIDIGALSPMDKNIIAAVLSDDLDYDKKRQIASIIKEPKKK